VAFSATTTEVGTICQTTSFHYFSPRTPVRCAEQSAAARYRTFVEAVLLPKVLPTLGRRMGSNTAIPANVLRERISPPARTTGLTARMWCLMGRIESDLYNYGADLAQFDLLYSRLCGR
jgi:hypothetical protein